MNLGNVMLCEKASHGRPRAVTLNVQQRDLDRAGSRPALGRAGRTGNEETGKLRLKAVFEGRENVLK